MIHFFPYSVTNLPPSGRLAAPAVDTLNNPVMHKIYFELQFL